VLSPKGNVVKVSIYADDVDLEDNFRVATMATDQLNHTLKIAPDIRIAGHKNPELLDSKGIRGDRVSPKWNNIKTATDNAFKSKLSVKKKGQLAKEDNAFLIIEVNFKPTNANIATFTKQSWSKFKHYKTIDYIIIYNDDKIIKIKREVIELGYDTYLSMISKVLK